MLRAVGVAEEGEESMDTDIFDEWDIAGWGEQGVGMCGQEWCPGESRLKHAKVLARQGTASGGMTLWGGRAEGANFLFKFTSF